MIKTQLRTQPSIAVRSAARSGQRSLRSRVVRVQAAADVSKLQAQFGIPDAIEVVEGRGGLPTVVLKHACGSSAEVVLFGGCVTSWKQSSGDEVLYIRPDAKFDGSKPISGGIPHCFPQFGPGAMQQHGFARNLEWAVCEQTDEKLVLLLTESEFTLAMWPHSFE